MSQGFYKRRRGVLEHVDSGLIDLLELGVHDYLNLKANLVIGNSWPLPAGICVTSAAALHCICPRVSERTVQRILNKLERIGWIKTSWKRPGKRGNYVILICRASVHDLSGKEYRVNGEATIDWRRPVYVPVDESSGSCRGRVDEVSGDREVENIETGEKRKNPVPEKPAPDRRFQPCFDFAFQSFQTRHGRKPSWQGKDWKALRNLLASNKDLGLTEFQIRWTNYLTSRDAFTQRQGDGLAYFCSHADSFFGEPIFQKGKTNGSSKPTIGDNASITLESHLEQERLK